MSQKITRALALALLSDLIDFYNDGHDGADSYETIEPERLEAMELFFQRKTRPVKKYDPRTCQNSVPCHDCEIAEGKKPPRKRRMSPQLYDAAHPARQAAIQIIEQVIEPLVGHGINGGKFYALEDRITEIIANE